MTTERLKAVAHPLRLRIMETIGTNVRSPTQLAQELQMPLANVAYHVAILVNAGVLTLVETRPVRGAVEHFYRATSTVCTCCDGSGLREVETAGVRETPSASTT